MSYDGDHLLDEVHLQVNVNGAELDDRIVGFRVDSSAEAPIDGLELQLDNGDGLADTVAKGDPVQLSLGFAGGRFVREVFNGTVESVDRGQVLSIIGVDDGAKLRDLVVKRSWVAPTPQDIALAVCDLAGLASELAADTLPRLPRFVAASLSGIDVLSEVKRAWGLDWELYAADGQVWFGPWQDAPRQRERFDVQVSVVGDDVFGFEVDANQVDRGRLVLHCTPQLRHSDVVVLMDAEFGRDVTTARAVRVSHVLGEHPHWPEYRTEVEWVAL